MTTELLEEAARILSRPSVTVTALDELSGEFATKPSSNPRVLELCLNGEPLGLIEAGAEILPQSAKFFRADFSDGDFVLVFTDGSLWSASCKDYSWMSNFYRKIGLSITGLGSLKHTSRERAPAGVKRSKMLDITGQFGQHRLPGSAVREKHDGNNGFLRDGSEIKFKFISSRSYGPLPLAVKHLEIEKIPIPEYIQRPDYGYTPNVIRTLILEELNIGDVITEEHPFSIVKNWLGTNHTVLSNGDIAIPLSRPEEWNERLPEIRPSDMSGTCQKREDLWSKIEFLKRLRISDEDWSWLVTMFQDQFMGDVLPQGKFSPDLQKTIHSKITASKRGARLREKVSTGCFSGYRGTEISFGRARGGQLRIVWELTGNNGYPAAYVVDSKDVTACYIFSTAERAQAFLWARGAISAEEAKQRAIARFVHTGCWESRVREELSALGVV